MTPTKALRALMAQHKLKNADVAELARVASKTVEGWLADPNAASYRQMPPRHLDVIRVMLPTFLRERQSRRGKK